VTTPRRTQADRSRATRQALVDAGRALFGERAYADVPADEIVRAAGVSRGALYHHFDGKHGLFRAVFESLEVELTDEIRAVSAAAPEQDRIVLALDAFLDACQRPEMVRIALTQAPAVLGWAEWRAIESEHGLGLIMAMLDEAHAAGALTVAPTRALAQVVLSAVIESALLIAHADDRTAARGEARTALLALLAGLVRS
jgi:AcrR family transcriptional regulator